MFSFQTTRILPLHTLMSSPFRFYSLLAGRGGGKGPETSPCPEQGLQAPLGRGRCCSQNVLSQHVWDIFGFHSPRPSKLSVGPHPHTHPPSLVLPWLREGWVQPSRRLPIPREGRWWARVPGRPLGGGHAVLRAHLPGPVGFLLLQQ